MRTETEDQGAAITEGLGAAVGEVASKLRFKAFAAESDATVPDAIGRQLSGSEREHFGLRESRIGQESSFDSDGSGTGGESGAQDALHQMRAADAGFTSRQAGPAVES